MKRLPLFLLLVVAMGQEGRIALNTDWLLITERQENLRQQKVEAVYVMDSYQTYDNNVTVYYNRWARRLLVGRGERNETL